MKYQAFIYLITPFLTRLANTILQIVIYPNGLKITPIFRKGQQNVYVYMDQYKFNIDK